MKMEMMVKEEDSYSLGQLQAWEAWKLSVESHTIKVMLENLFELS